MAKSVADFLVDLKVDGIKDVNALKGSLRALMGASKITGKSLLDISSAVKQFKTNSKDSVQVIRGQVQALKGLQQQAGLNSAAFKKLGQDVALYESKLRSAEAAVVQSRTSFAAARTRFIKRTPGALLERIGQVRSAATAKPFDERGNVNQEYITQQQELNVLTKVETRLQERLALKIREGNKAKVDSNVENKTAAQLQAIFGKELNDGVNTTAQMSLRLRELKEDFQDLTIGSREYIQALNRISYFEKRVADPFGSAARKQAIRSRLGTQEKFGMFAGRDPVQSAIDRRERRRSRRYGGFTGGGLANQPVEASGLFKQIASISGAGPAAELQMMGRSYEQVAQSIRAATLASNGSINSLQSQRTAWAQLQAGLNPATNAYKQVGIEIEKVDRRLQKLNSRRKFSAKGLAQSAGAIAAGGIFGGPEGAVGGLLGAPFGPGGAAAGAALGAQLGMMRQALGATSEYAAELKKLEIALEGVAGTDFDAAMKAAADVTRDLNVPQEVAIRGMTRLSAAVIGAGGNVADAEVVFKNVTSAIKGTGGSAQDVSSAITAMVQVFSKGKVSAEELSGQLGERLPGAVTKFADANFEGDMIALQKALKDGTVGLNELMKFIIGLGDEYTEVAKKIADSSADAGAKSQVAFDAMRREIGNALQPIGAQLQLAFAEFITDILPALTVAAKIAAKALEIIMEVSAFLVKHFDDIAVVAGVLGTAIGTAGLVKSVGLAGGALNGLKLILFDVKLAIAGVGKALVFLAANPVVLLISGITALGVFMYRAATANDRFNKSIASGEKTLEEGREKVEEIHEEIDTLQKKLNEAPNRRLILGLRRQMAKARGELAELNNAIEVAIYADFAGPAGFVGPVIAGMKFEDEKPDPRLTRFADLEGDGDGDGGGGGSKQKPRVSLLESILRRKQLLGVERQLLENARSIGLAQSKNQASRVNQLNNQKIQLQFAKSAAEAEFEYLDALEQAANEENEQTKQQLLQEASARNEIKTALLLIQYQQALGDEAQRRALAEEQITKNIQQQEFDLRDRLGLVSPQEKIEKFKQGLIDKGEGDARIPGLVDLQRQIIDPTTFEKIQQTVRSLKKELEDLVNPANMIIKSAEAIGTAFTDSFMSVITGSATAKEALANFFKNVGKFFLDMAAQIIQKMITMYILNQVLRVLPFSGGGFGGMDTSIGGGINKLNPTNFVAGPFSSFGRAKDGAYFSNGIARFARGGIVNSPTLFPYADGGTGRFGLMGEAGAEAILPLQRGPEGKLGVQASGPDNAQMLAAMNRYQRSIKASGTGAQGEAAGVDGPGGAAGSAAIDVRFKVERINNVDYVTAAEFQEGMQQAAKQGAQRGEQQAIKRLQMSSSTRKRIGL